MASQPRPYLILPKLVEQPTWGGTYIVEYKGWDKAASLQGKKIGQSYELFGQSILLADVTNTADPRFSPEPNDRGTQLILADMVQDGKEAWVGASVWNTYGAMPLLVKFNQALGNSFQLHRKESEPSSRWTPKPESWYYMEDGALTFGIKKGTDVAAYKQCCLTIESKMKELSAAVVGGTKKLADARLEAKTFIAEKNPWQYVNVHTAKKYDLVDLSAGGLHHSWEEDLVHAPLGNVVYEVQKDVMDPICTIRSFDQGKIQDDGTIRNIAVEDYFTFLDTDEAKNDIQSAIRHAQGNTLLSTQYYSLDLLTVAGTYQDAVGPSFVHLFVRDGDVDIEGAGVRLHVGRGHSCFIPYAVGTYTITSRTPESVVLKTYIAK